MLNILSPHSLQGSPVYIDQQVIYSQVKISALTGNYCKSKLNGYVRYCGYDSKIT